MAVAAEWTVNNRYNIGPDVRWWTGHAPANPFASYALGGVQIVANYGTDLKLSVDNAFAVTLSADSGYLWTQTKRIVADPRNPYLAIGAPTDVAKKYSAEGPLDVFLGGRFDLKINSVVQPYAQVGVNRSQKTALTTNDAFAFSKDSDRDLRGKFGSGDFYEVRSGSVVNVNKNLALDIYWKQNFGTRYKPNAAAEVGIGGHPGGFDGGPSGADTYWSNGNTSITARMEYSNDTVTLSGGYQETQFKENGYRTILVNAGIFGNGPVDERWIPGHLRIFNAKGEMRFGDNWFVYAEGSYSQQDANLKTVQYYVTDDIGLPFTREASNSNPIKYSALAGFGYYTPGWSAQLQGLYSRDEQNGYDRTSSLFLADRTRYGAEAIISLRPANWGSIQARFSYLHVNGLGPAPGAFPPSPGFPGGNFNANPGYAATDIYTVYLTGNLKFAAN